MGEGPDATARGASVVVVWCNHACVIMCVCVIMCMCVFNAVCVCDRVCDDDV